jgi:hypothetical protein
MATAHPNAADTTRSATAVEGMMRDIGYVLWLTRMLAAESKVSPPEPIRPEMSDFCAVDAAAFAA